MTEIEKSYREGFEEGSWGEKRNEDDAWNESESKHIEINMAAQRKIVREASEKLKEQFRNGGA